MLSTICFLHQLYGSGYLLGDLNDSLKKLVEPFNSFKNIGVFTKLVKKMDDKDKAILAKIG